MQSAAPSYAVGTKREQASASPTGLEAVHQFVFLDSGRSLVQSRGHPYLREEGKGVRLLPEDVGPRRVGDGAHLPECSFVDLK